MHDFRVLGLPLMAAWMFFAALACSGDSDSGTPPDVPAGNLVVPGNTGTTTGDATAGQMPGTPGAGAVTGGGDMPSMGGVAMDGSGGTDDGAAADMAGGMADGSAGMGATDDGMGSGAGDTTMATGMKDGDPTAPIVEVPGVPCREESALGGPGFGSSINATIGGRELAIDYPCGKHEGAHMTVILNLHGTLIGGANFLYQRNYFSAYRLVHSHNLIVIHPQSVSTASFGAQWGNEDGGADLPHLIEVMNWVYENFAKFQIRSTWIAGHSWGALYAEGGLGREGFVCNEMFADRFKGVIGMSRLGVPACSDRVSMIGTRGSEEDIPLLDQSAVATKHGCDVPMAGPEMLGNNERFYFEGCDPGWVHEDYNMLGKGHIDSMDPEVVLKIVESIKSTEL